MGRYHGTPSVTWILTDVFQELLIAQAIRPPPPPRTVLAPFWYSPASPMVVVERIK
jgi:hypothetical protein